jgi:XTP/dITP diphosphohydrolase
VQEIAAILHQLGLKDIELHSLSAYADYIPPEENGATFAENALIKAQAAAAFSGYTALADDSGLAVTALDGAPGVYSARYAGPGADSAANNAKLLLELAFIPSAQRQATFVCVIALASPDGSYEIAEGKVEGMILTELRGQNGFGYDPLFYLPQHYKTMAELNSKEKNRLSHRAQALEKAFRRFIYV